MNHKNSEPCGLLKTSSSRSVSREYGGERQHSKLTRYNNTKELLHDYNI